MATTADTTLARCLGALSSPLRLSMMRTLRMPRTLREIEVRGEEDGAKLSRQGVRRHLDRLLEAGVISTRSAARDWGDATEFVVNHQRVFAVSEEVRNLARLRPLVEPQEATLPGVGASPLKRAGPMLVLVKGLDEGSTFDLRPHAGKGEWIIGRRRNAAVPLDFDPTVSSENALIRFEEGRHLLQDLPGSRNGTTHNLRRLEPDERVPLSHGDLVGAGRSLLLFWQ